jgi:hypothetical protein
MQRNSKYGIDEALPCLPDPAWALLVVALVPHLLALVSSTAIGTIAACACFPASMGLFAPLHAGLIAGRLGFTSNMAWILAVLFTLTWSAGLCWLSKKNKEIAVATAAFCFIATAVPVWLLLTT